MRREQIQAVRDMNAYFPKVVEQLKGMGDACNLIGESDWLEKLLYYTVPGGKMVRAVTVYEGIMVLGGRDTPGLKEKAMNIAWSMEMVQASMLIADDISDESFKRRGRDSWHVIAGKDAVFDAILVSTCAYALLGMHCDGEAFHRSLRNYNEILFQICMGQNQDNHCTDPLQGKAKFDEFNMDRYTRVCEHKSGGYTFFLPMSTALNVCGIFDEAAHDAARDISSDLGLLYQVQDDYLDTYGIIRKMGKGRTDIKNGKCTWIIVEAINRANDEQRQRLKENYGYDDPKKVDKVLEVFTELKMKEVFLQWEKSMMDKIEGKIRKYSDLVNPEVFTQSLESIKYHINR
ncbi:farnesyl pyrophosphate synthase-like isoform X2 [Thrips palmi]|nr:farnesyl pyrophosphate synthase-like isoform X2 [Thrips palmi]